MKRVLVFNFFAGVKDRGIPIYAREILEGLSRAGAQPRELSCPTCLRRAPDWLLNVLFVFFEQCIAPLMRMLWRCSTTIYPYNSAGLIDAVLGKSILVIHDLIPNSRQRRSLSARYIRLSQAAHRRLARPVCAASLHTLTRLRRLVAFSSCSLHLWSNPFYSFATVIRALHPVPRRGRLKVLLCSGIGPNKDYAGAIQLIRRSHVLADAHFSIVGFGDDAALAQRRVDRLPEDVRQRITVLPRLSMAELALEYKTSDVVWVHSLQEGYGRSVVEARIASRPVFASNIGSFRALEWLGVTLYSRHKDDFDTRLRELLATPPRPFRMDILDGFHRSLEDSIRLVLGLATQKLGASEIAEPPSTVRAA